MEDAVELARRSIYHATFRDAVSGGTVSGAAFIFSSSMAPRRLQQHHNKCLIDAICGTTRTLLRVFRVAAVYHVAEDGWKKVVGSDVGLLHYEYYPTPEAHPCQGEANLVLIL